MKHTFLKVLYLLYDTAVQYTILNTRIIFSLLFILNIQDPSSGVPGPKSGRANLVIDISMKIISNKKEMVPFF